jgi:putative SOS response-associated peptidase YedK
MCNLYTLAPWEVRHLIQHYRLIGRDFEEVMRARNDSLDVYPNRPAPVVLEKDGQRVVRQDMLWGFPPFRQGRRLWHQLPKPEKPSVATMA